MDRKGCLINTNPLNGELAAIKPPGREIKMGYRDIAKELDRLAEEYKRVWKIADAEKKQTGWISRATEDILVSIENQLVALVA